MFSVVKRTNGITEQEGVYDHRDQAELRLIDVLAYTISNFEDYDADDIQAIRDQGFERFGSGAVWIEEDGSRPNIL